MHYFIESDEDMITWGCEITNVDVANKRADVQFTRTDDVTGDVESYGFSQAILGTSEERVAILELVWAKHLDAIAKQTAIDDFISNLELQAKSNLESREI